MSIGNDLHNKKTKKLDNQINLNLFTDLVWIFSIKLYVYIFRKQNIIGSDRILI